MKNAKYMEIHKGDIVFADLGETIGSEQSGMLRSRNMIVEHLIAL